MPLRYEKMRDAFIREGMPTKAAKTKAAKIYNATRKSNEPTLAAHVKREKGKRPK